MEIHTSDICEYSQVRRKFRKVLYFRATGWADAEHLIENLRSRREESKEIVEKLWPSSIKGKDERAKVTLKGLDPSGCWEGGRSCNRRFAEQATGPSLFFFFCYMCYIKTALGQGFILILVNRRQMSGIWSYNRAWPLFLSSWQLCLGQSLWGTATSHQLYSQIWGDEGCEVLLPEPRGR